MLVSIGSKEVSILSGAHMAWGGAEAELFGHTFDLNTRVHALFTPTNSDVHPGMPMILGEGARMVGIELTKNPAGPEAGVRGATLGLKLN